MQKLSKAITFFGTAAAALVLAALTALTVKTWAYMFIPAKASWAIALGVTLVPAWLLNKMLTRAYSKHEISPSESGSLFGMLFMVNLAAVGLIWSGFLSAASPIALQESGRYLAVNAGVMEPVDEASLETFPTRSVGTGFVWVPNLGSKASPKVIARMDDGRLRAVDLPPRGTLYSDARSEVMVGPIETEQVMLVPVPEDPNEIRNISVRWSGGAASFSFKRGQKTARFDDSRVQ